MGSIVVTESISLDGVIEAPGPQDVEDFRYKGWAFDHGVTLLVYKSEAATG
jgi:hypothetical protein